MSIQYAGGTNVNATFTGAVKNDILTNVESNLITAGWSLVQGNVPTVVTMTIASPCVVSWTAHGLIDGTRIVFSTTGALPTGVTAGTVYFVKSPLSNTFNLATTSGGTALNTSGSQSGTHTAAPELLMQSASTPWSVATRIRFRDGGSGSTCITFSIENSNSSLAGANNTTNGGYLLPAASKVFRVVANKYQAFIFSAATTAARSFVAFGTPYLPTFLQGAITECGWLGCNATNDTDGATRVSFRTNLQHTTSTNTNDGNFQTIVNTNLLDVGSSSNLTAVLSLLFPSGPARGFPGAQTGFHWHDTSALMQEPLLMWPTSSTGVEALIRGQLWDGALVMDTFAGDTTTTFDSHNWWAITDADSGEKGTLFVVVP